MAKKRLAKGDSLVCVPCGAEYLVTETGAAYAEAWCCGVPMQTVPGKKAAPKAAPRKALKKAAAPARKAASKKAPAKKKR